MADKTTNDVNNTEKVDTSSIGKANNPISKATLVMIAAAIIFIIIAGVIISKFFSAPTGNTNLSPSETSVSRLI